LVVADSLEDFILSYLERATTKISAADFVRICVQKRHVNRSTVQTALRRLVADERIQYTNFFGTTQVDLAWSRPRWVSPHILLCPKDSAIVRSVSPGAAVLCIAGGAAFGAGDHPTTRLALQALDTLFSENRIRPSAAVLDIGTGSGVLAIGAVLLGAETALGLDIDPCAVWEARANVRLNDLAMRIRVSAEPVEDLVESFDLVLANLRLPTLLRLTPILHQRLTREGAVVISGIRPDEVDALLKRWSEIGLDPCWRKESQGWAGMGFCRVSKRP
jgi:ribosomal protein L11 methyltransferase